MSKNQAPEKTIKESPQEFLRIDDEHQFEECGHTWDAVFTWMKEYATAEHLRSEKIIEGLQKENEGLRKELNSAAGYFGQAVEHFGQAEKELAELREWKEGIVKEVEARITQMGEALKQLPKQQHERVNGNLSSCEWFLSLLNSKQESK